MNNFNLKNFLTENKLTTNSRLVNEDLTVVGHTPEEQLKNAEELVAAAKAAGRDPKIQYNTNPGFEDQINSVDIGPPGLGTPSEVQAVQDRQFAEYEKNKPKDTKPSYKPKKLKKLTKGGKTYEIGDFDPNDDGRIESIEKYPNGYYIQGGIYSDYGDGDEPKGGYGYAIDLDGNEMDEEDLEGMHEGSTSSLSEIDPNLLKRAQNTPAPKDASARLAKRKASIDNQKAGTLQVSKGPNAEQEQKVIDIAKDAIALMDEQPGTSAVEALAAVLRS